jgi:hypothetical protein
MSSLGFATLDGPNGDSCFTTVDPKYSKTGAPARMADGRVMTDYRPRCHQYPVKAAANFGDNEYRARMIHGAEELMDAARQLNNRKVMPTACVDTMVPELYKRVCTWQGCKTVPGNFQGIGTGRIYVPSGEAAADKPQELSDMTIPAIPNTFARVESREASQCAAGDYETRWSIKGPAAQMGSSAKSHPYSAPRA